MRGVELGDYTSTPLTLTLSRWERGFCSTLFLAALVTIVLSSPHAMADQNTHCKIYGNCIDSPKAAEKGADLVIEDINRDAKGNPVTPADMDVGDRSDLGKNVEIELKKPLRDKTKKSNAGEESADDAKKKSPRDAVLDASEVNIGTVSVDAKTGKTKLQTPPQPNPDKCDYSYMVGRKLSEITMPKNARILHEGDAVTMEYMQGRVNIILDKNDVIVNVTCG